MQNIKTNTVVIGGGPAGYPAAIRLGQLKIPTVIIEKKSLGGTCLNVGCIPSKALINVATKYYSLKNDWPQLGIKYDKADIDWHKTIEWKDKIVKKTTSGVKLLLKANKVEQITGHAKILSSNKCQVDDKYTIEFENLVIATGSKIVELADFKFDAKHILNSTDLLDLKKIPKSMIILGGGIIGMELGTVYSCLGCDVTIVEALPRILTMYEEEATAVVQREFEKRGGKIMLDTKAVSFSKTKDSQITLKILQNGKKAQIKAEKLAVAVGRKSNFDALGLENIDVKTENGRIVVDDTMQTSTKNIYAVGDIVAGPMLAHKATLEGVLAAEAIAGKKISRSDVKVIADVVYTKPEIAQVGMNEKELAQKGIQIALGKFPLTALGIAATKLEDKGYVKYVADKKSGVILGATVVSYNAADMISEAALAIEMGATLEDIALTVHPHPSFGEAHMESALAALSQAIHIVNK